jgi:hypothetical protein
MFFNIIILLINTIIFSSVYNLPDNQASKESKASYFIFETSDVIKEYVRDDGTRVRLDAYKTEKNEALMSSQQYKGLRWVSFGKPEIVKINNQDLFQMQSKVSFSLYFEMLTNRDKEVLADEVYRAKNITVDPSQFSNCENLVQTQLNVTLKYLIRMKIKQLF